MFREVEVERIKKSLKRVSGYTVIFDGSSRVDEVLAVILRFVTHDFSIVLDVVRLGKYQSYKDHQQKTNDRLRILSSNSVCIH
jgi:hypothetical protein